MSFPNEMKVKSERTVVEPHESQLRKKKVPPFPKTERTSEASLVEMKKSLFETILDMEKKSPIASLALSDDEEMQEPLTDGPVFASYINNPAFADNDFDSIDNINSAPFVQGSLPNMQVSQLHLETITPYMQIDPEVLTLFDKMVGVMSMMDQYGVMETTIHLTSPEFASSMFYGAQILIQEFSTAPKCFNIQLIADSSVQSIFQNHISQLMASFHNSNYTFKINRLEVYLPTDAPYLFKRKEDMGKEKDDDGKKDR